MKLTEQQAFKLLTIAQESINGTFSMSSSDRKALIAEIVNQMGKEKIVMNEEPKELNDHNKLSFIANDIQPKV